VKWEEFLQLAFRDATRSERHYTVRKIDTRYGLTWVAYPTPYAPPAPRKGKEGSS
jgi:hypothetical protein